MRELRSAANAFFWFALFLVGWALVVPPPEGSARGSRPRFLRMVIEDTGHRGHTERVHITVPWFLFRSGLHAVSAGKLEREANLHFDDTVTSEIVREAWTELSAQPEGTDVVKRHDDAELTFRKEKGEIRLTVKDGLDEDGGPPREVVTIRFPARFMEAAVSGDRDLDVEALFAEMKRASRGDVLEVTSDDAHVRVVID
ncbi:MAG: hypothetical protein KJ062_03400 [Thermoanaerobaculia bacterium]|nr:hypothetical protein [Thermoanaerobaculia bacterium]